MIHKGVKFKEHVGVLQIGNVIIEVLPKADHDTDTDRWRSMLIGMIRASGMFDLKSPTSSHLKIRANAILDLYFERFVSEIEYLLHRGLSKKYRKTQGNITSFKGRIIFPKHIQHNYIHLERVYAEYTEFTREHLLHQVLYKTLCLLQHLNTDASLKSRIASLLLDFPEMPDVKVSEKLFKRIVLNRNTQHYKAALEIARMLLLNYHPDISKGNNDVLALMFDMNALWERFAYISLKKHLKEEEESVEIRAQHSKYYWKQAEGNRTTVRPDIFLCIGEKQFVLDTKWKNLDDYGPSSSDLHQMFVYHDYFNAEKVALLYPSDNERMLRGNYLDRQDGSATSKECSLMPIKVGEEIAGWQRGIADTVMKWTR
ncbi:MAG: McrC family protein [Bacteroidota bacterium]